MATTDESLPTRWVKTLHHPQWDLATAALFVLLADVGVAVLAGPARVLLGLPLVTFLPGYALLSALFPGRYSGDADVSRWRGHDVARQVPLAWRERVALSFGTSIALVPLVALASWRLGLGLEPGTVATSLGVVTVVGLVLGAVRRRRLPEEAQFTVPLGRWTGELYAGLVDEDHPVDRALNVALVLVVVLAVGGMGYALAAPNSAGNADGLLLLTEEETGEYVAAGYPDTVAPGGSAELVVGVTNRARTAQEYTVVVELQRVRPGDGAVTEREELRRLHVGVAPGETVRLPHTVSPTLRGEDMRLTYFLYRDAAPASPTTESAHRWVHVWIDVTPPDG